MRAWLVVALLLTTSMASADPVAVSPDGDADGEFIVVSGTGDASCRDHVPPAIFGIEYVVDCIAVSGTGNASCGNYGPYYDAIVPCVAVSGTGSAQNCSEAPCRGNVYLTGEDLQRTGADLATNDCHGSRCIDINATGDAEGTMVAVSGTGNAEASCTGVHRWFSSRALCLAASGGGNATGSQATALTGDATSTCSSHGRHPPGPVSGVPRPRFCQAASGTGDAAGRGEACQERWDRHYGYGGWYECEETTDYAVSGTGNATGRHAASGTGDTHECRLTGYESCHSHEFGFSPLGGCRGHARCVDVGAFDDADGGWIGVSILGNSSGKIAASGTGDARGDAAATGTGDAVSECASSQSYANMDTPRGIVPCAAATGSGDARGEGESCVERAEYRWHPGWGSHYHYWYECEESTDYAVSGTGNATGRTAISGTGHTQPCQPTGYETCQNGREQLEVLHAVLTPADPWLDLANNDCGDRRCWGVQGNDDAEARYVAVSGTGDATTDCRPTTGPSYSVPGQTYEFVLDLLPCAAVSGAGNADARCNTIQYIVTAGTCLAASGTGDAGNESWCAVEYRGPESCHGTTTFAVSGTGDASGVYAASGTGDATGHDVAVSGTGTPSGGEPDAASASWSVALRDAACDLLGLCL